MIEKDQAKMEVGLSDRDKLVMANQLDIVVVVDKQSKKAVVIDVAT